MLYYVHQTPVSSWRVEGGTGYKSKMFLMPVRCSYYGSDLQHTNATSSPLSAVVFMSQIIMYTVCLNVPLHMYIENRVTGFTYIALQVLLVLCGIWSLDFFRFVVPTFCVSKQPHGCSSIWTGVFSGIYPIFLILITYVYIKLHTTCLV